MTEGCLRVGQNAPNFTAEAVVDQEFKNVSLTDFRGKWVVLFFYPLDFTFVCPTEITAFSDRYSDFSSKNTEIIFNELIKFGKHLLKWIDLYSPEHIKKNYSMPLYNMIDGSEMNLLRIIHYPPIKSLEEKDAIRAAPHEDINLITLLSPGSEPGLQVMNKNGKWIDVNCNPEWLVINTGDMLNKCSNGYFPSTTHRVINPNKHSSNISRFTIPLFIHPREEVKLSKKYTAGSFLDERLKEIGLKK